MTMNYRLLPYTPFDWYWAIAGSPPTIYGSARAATCPATDEAYLTWLAAYGEPSSVPSAAALDTNLIAAGLPASGLVPPTQAQLIAYANAKQWALATGGYTTSLTPVGGSGPQSITFPTDDVSLGLINGKVARFAYANPPTSTDWQTGPATFVDISAADFPIAAAQIADFIQSSFDAVKPILAAIAAGTITTTAQIDAAAWPSNVSTTQA